MNGLWLTRITLVWGVLVMATLLSWQLGHGVGFGGAKAAGVTILIVTFIKARFVILDFMEVREAPAWMRALWEGWVVLCAASLIALFITGTQ